MGELSGDNTTGKPSFNYDQAGAQISRDNRKWDGGELGTAGDVTYSFLSNSQAGGGYRQLTAEQMASTKKAMDIISSVANITFNPADGGSGNNISDQGEIRFQGYDGGGGWASWSYRGGGATAEITSSTVALGSASLSLALHEIGHAIALSHPGDYNGGGFSYENDAEFYQDSEQYTVMQMNFAFIWPGVEADPNVGGGKSGYFPNPAGPGGHFAQLGGQGISVVSYSSKQDAALEYIKWFAQPEIQKKWWESGGYSALRAVVEDPGFATSQPYAQTFLDSMAEWCGREDFRKALPDLLEGEDDEFGRYILKLAETNAISDRPS